MPAESLLNPIAPVSETSLLRTLQTVFGFGQFRTGQTEVIAHLLGGGSALAVFPTGSGKSLCYQLPALHLDGLTLVISPLIALMKDQLDFLHAKGIPAARLDSSLDRDETMAIHLALTAGEIKILYTSPERLSNERFVHRLKRLKISLLAIDESHCISQWGHNFRPDYLKIATLAKELAVERVLALTATATPPVVIDISQAFDISANHIVLTGFHRPNLELHGTPVTDKNRFGTLLRRLRERPQGPTIVYVTLQHTAEDVARKLEENGLNARAYHAGMESAHRTRVQDDFMASASMIVVATIAFGMGIDKHDIRAVYHYNLPKSMENYMQEIGRAGRDGKPAICEILACHEDVVTLENFTYGDTPTRESIESMVGGILSQSSEFDVGIWDLSMRHDMRDLVVRTLLTYLELEGVIESMGPFYSKLKYRFLRPEKAVLASFNESRQEFLRSIFNEAKRGSKWNHLDVDAATVSLAEPRTRIVAALDYLDQAGDILVEAAGVRLRYRRLERPTDQSSLTNLLADRFETRELQDVTRVNDMMRFALSKTCRTRLLLDYFGEKIDECQHCDHCLDSPRLDPIQPDDHHPGPGDQAAIIKLRARGHTALKTPRQMTRFLCGLPSPAATRSKLKSHPDFGRCREIAFGRVFEMVGANWDQQPETRSGNRRS